MNNKKYNDIFVKAEVGKEGKKGEGMKAILVLLKDISDFQTKIEQCIEAQEISENRDAIEEFDSYIDEMCVKLLDMVREGMRSMRNRGFEDLQDEVNADTDEVEIEEEPSVIDEIEPVIESKSSPTVTKPTAPKM